MQIFSFDRYELDMKRNVLFPVLLSLIVIITLALPVFADDGVPCNNFDPAGFTS